MSRLANILNGIINPFGKQLWSGTWTRGSVIVSESSKYTAFIVDISGTACLGLRSGSYIFCMGVSSSSVEASAQQFIKSAVLSVNGDTWTLTRVKQTNHNENSSAHTLSTSSIAINRIVGLIPNGGGLLKSIISSIHLHKEVLA